MKFEEERDRQALVPIQVDPELVPGNSDRFKRQVEFLLEIDRLKHIFRQTILLDRSRHENSVEHSWHIAMSVMIFAEYADTTAADIGRVIRMLLLHDLVEIDAGDTYCYDEQAGVDQHERERRAADRIFGLLPPDQARDFRRLWDEFEDATTPEARYAHAMDRFQAFLHNYFTQGRMWGQHGIRRHQVIRRMQPVERGAPLLWDYVRTLIDDAVLKGYLLP
ncbi:MAG: phosphohydrolase [Deltaproteobacteria bacterium]|jgi:putative hydrolase of HD superfamily|nr:phosphohydrolase [Deltaproteobacteria bacterium]